MLTIIELCFFAAMQTYFAWHLLTCPAAHPLKIAFVFTLMAGAFWALTLMQIIEYRPKRSDKS